MALIKSIKHSKSKLVGYIKKAKKLFHGSPDGDRKPEFNAKANVSREIENAPMNIITEPAAATAITGAHVGDTEVVPNEGYDYDYRAWNELPPTPSEPPLPPKPSTASAPELKGQEPTVDNGDNILLEIASIGDSITRIIESASDSSSTLTTTTPTTITSTPTTINSLPLDRAIWVPKPNLSISSSSFASSSANSFYSSPTSPKRFQGSPFFGKKIGVTPRVSRIPSVSGVLDPGTPAFESPTAGSTMVGGFENEPKGHSEDEASTLIERKEGGFETFGGENGGRPFAAILADLREVLGHHSSPTARTTASPPSLSIEEGYQLAFDKVRELRGCLTDRGRPPKTKHIKT